jgi:hypothetical protein
MKRTLVLLLGLGIGAVAVALGARLSFQEHAAVQESLSHVHPRMRAGWLRAHGLDDSYYTTFHSPESTNGLKCIGRWPWGPSWELAGKDTFLYLGSGSGVRILSIADSVHPRMLGQINARSLVSQLAIKDSLLFVACGSWGAQVYSVSDPANPRELGSMDAVIGDLCVQDTFCYAVGGDSLRIYNVASPSQPSLVGAIRDSGDLVVVANGYAFSAGRWVMNIYNVTDPAHPTWANSRGGPAYAMFVRRNLLFCSSVQSDNMTVLNIADPLNITQVSKVDGYGGEGLYVDDLYAYLSCTYGHSGLFVIDVSDSSRPAMRDSINPEGVEEWEPYVPHSPGYGYLADAHGGLVTVDLHDVSSISEEWSGYKADKAIDVHIDGRLAYIADDLSGLQIVDVSDPERPSSVGLFDVVGTRETYTAEARDSFAFIGWWGSNRRFLRVLDVTDPSSPVFAAEESCRNPPQDIVLRDTLLYCVEQNQVQIFSVARPREPVRVGSCEGDGVALVVQDTFAYTAAGAIRVTNVARPDSPFVASTIWRASRNLQVLDTILVCAPGPVMWYNIARPASPTVIDSIDLGHSVYGLTAVDSVIYASTTGGFLYAISIADLHQPRILCRTTLPYYIADRLVYAPPHLYLACEVAGVCVMETASVGIAEATSQSSRLQALAIWPNPTTGSVVMTGLAGPRVEVRVRDVAERIVSAQRDAVCDLRCELDLANIRPGVYFVEAASGRRRSSVKLIKQ